MYALAAHHSLGEPPPSYYGGKTLVEYLKLWADHLAGKAGAGEVTGLNPICQDFGAARGFLVITSSGRRFVLDCDTGQTWAELVETGGGELPSKPAPKPATEADVLAALANTHLFLDPSLSAPQVRAGGCPADRVQRTLPGSSLVICTPANTHLFRAPSAGLNDAVLAWGDKPPAGWKNVGAWGNSTLYEAPAGTKAGSLPQSLATFTAAALAGAPASPLAFVPGKGAVLDASRVRKIITDTAPTDAPPPEEKPAPPKSRAGLFFGLAAAGVALAWLKPWK